MRYRSAVIFGQCTPHTDPDEKLRALDTVVEALLPGRLAEVRRSTRKELARTLVLALPITEWSLKVSGGWPDDPPEDCAGPARAGVIPVQVRYRAPIPAPGLRAGILVPSPSAVSGILPASSMRVQPLHQLPGEYDPCTSPSPPPTGLSELLCTQRPSIGDATVSRS